MKEIMKDVDGKERDRNKDIAKDSEIEE